ncbi:hypothetical protein [Marinomonas sp. GJ51-6]|uniref:hypothetical protein n=1 Tax=Marinomonas sp. GJ51-6 TaxID=2992802 RepID=UPI002934892C|nr:hypothetical protein [Marinomonas sp. GJ51-6]WOD07637.1 hypothetical protein ONZ50_00135 [Marinomonas sp. GJ51-6]
MPIRYSVDALPAFSVDPEQFDVLQSARHFREYLLEAIRKATTRIYIVALYLEDDDAGREVLAALYEAKLRNPDLDVVVCVDWHRVSAWFGWRDKIKGQRRVLSGLC